MLTPIYRIEHFLDAIVNNSVNPYLPEYRVEYFLAKIAGENVAIPDPTYRIEFYLAYLCGEEVELPDPIYRIEYYLAFLCGLNVELPEPIYRVEFWLWDWCGGGGIEKTVTGNPIHITDALAKPVQALSVKLEPIQAGSGDPSPDNVRPITGWTDCKVTRTGKNLLSPHLYTGMAYDPTIGATVTLADSPVQLTDNGDGTFSLTTTQTWRYYTMIVPVKSGVSYALSYGFSSTGQGGRSWGYLDKDFKVVTKVNSTVQNASYSSVWQPETGAYIYLVITNRGTAAATITITNPQVEIGSATAYEAYQGETYTVTFPAEAGTVYGGTLDVTSGKLTVDRSIVDLGTLDWSYNSNWGGSGAFYCSEAPAGIKKNNPSNILPNAICSNYKTYTRDYLYYNPAATGFCIPNNTGCVSIRDSAYNDVMAFKTAMSGVQLCYELATPIEAALTPTEIALFAGENNLWSDANGNLELTYLADGNASDVEALNILLGGRYVNNHGEDEPTDREALDILLGRTK